MVSQDGGPGSRSRRRRRGCGRPRPRCAASAAAVAARDAGRAHRAGAGGHRPLDRRCGAGASSERRCRRRAAAAVVGGSSPAASRAVMSSAIRCGEDQALEQRVGGQPVGAVHAGAGDLTAGVEAVEGGPADAGRSRRRRWRSAGRGRPAAGSVAGSKPSSRQPGDDRGEAALEELARRGAGRRGRRGRVPVARIRATMARATTSRGARSAISWTPCMNRTPSRVDEERALAADRLGDQRLLAAGALAEPQHRRVELDELEVGDHRAGAQRGGDAVAGGDGRVGGGGVDLARGRRSPARPRGRARRRPRRPGPRR